MDRQLFAVTVCRILMLRRILRLKIKLDFTEMC